MNIKQVSYGLIGSVLMSGALLSCDEKKHADKAKAQAVNYLRGDELLKAERFASQQRNYAGYNGEAVLYWDSLLMDAKAKEAYVKGQQIIRDSVSGKFFRKEKFKAPLDTVITEREVIANSKNEYAQYISGADFVKARENAPEDRLVGFSNDLAGTIHYWNLITISGKQNEAYKKGMADERLKIK